MYGSLLVGHCSFSWHHEQVLHMWKNPCNHLVPVCRQVYSSHRTMTQTHISTINEHIGPYEYGKQRHHLAVFSSAHDSHVTKTKLTVLSVVAATSSIWKHGNISSAADMCRIIIIIITGLTRLSPKVSLFGCNWRTCLILSWSQIVAPL